MNWGIQDRPERAGESASCFLIRRGPAPMCSSPALISRLSSSWRGYWTLAGQSSKSMADRRFRGR
eukprot:929912-Lingulodinium_polyedra.AAC.1